MENKIRKSFLTLMAIATTITLTSCSADELEQTPNTMEPTPEQPVVKTPEQIIQETLDANVVYNFNKLTEMAKIQDSDIVSKIFRVYDTFTLILCETKSGELYAKINP